MAAKNSKANSLTWVPDPMSDPNAKLIKRVREGDVHAAKKMMEDAAEALREPLPKGGRNIEGHYADYLAEVLDRLAKNDKTARPFCLDMPKHRPKQAEASEIHIQRARAVLALIKRVREGDIHAAKKMMEDAAKGLREPLPKGGRNIEGHYADYFADVLDRLAKNDKTARLFCLDMPKHRPKQANVSTIHIQRARAVLEKYQDGGTLVSAMRAVATKNHVSVGAIRASWRAEGPQAQQCLVIETPKSERGKLRFPGNHDARPRPHRKGNP